nr:immunoglobulin light chain junction region [Macaca mulatta]
DYYCTSYEANDTFIF